MYKSFEDKMKQYAALAVEVGVNVQQGQTLCIIAPIAAAEFVRIAVRRAYEVGAKYVHVDWSDETVTRTRFELAPEDSFSEYPMWHAQGREQMAAEGAAFLWVVADDPDLLAGIDPARITTYTKAHSTAMRPFRNYYANNKVAWSIVAVPSMAWASKVFPELPADERETALWHAIFAATRIDDPEPVLTWREHAAALNTCADRLNELNLKELHYRGPGTNLTIGLPEGHLWKCASNTNDQGTPFIPNMPTEEVFTSPHREKVYGTVKSSKPLSYGGNLIDHFSLTFKDGRIVDYHAVEAHETLSKLIETDEGSHYLGEVALVPHRSPISDTNLIFYNTLFDENAACHLAIGFALAFCLEGGVNMSKDELRERGLNDSLTHVDFMIGREDLDIDGITVDGRVIPVFRAGNWAL